MEEDNQEVNHDADEPKEADASSETEEGFEEIPNLIEGISPEPPSEAESTAPEEAAEEVSETPAESKEAAEEEPEDVMEEPEAEEEASELEAPPAGEVITWNQLQGIDSFAEFLEQVLKMELTYLDAHQGQLPMIQDEQRVRIIEFLGCIKTEEGGEESLFDQDSLNSMLHIFSQVEFFYQQLMEETHPAQHIILNREKWFYENYPLIYQPVLFLETVHFFAVGQSPVEKELLFRSMATKLIKTQESVRNMVSHESFWERYFTDHVGLAEMLPAWAKETFQLPKEPSPKDACLTAILAMINDVSKVNLKMLRQAGIPSPEPAQAEIEKKKWYNAFVLTMRHTEEGLFEMVESKRYKELVAYLGQMTGMMYSHPFLYLYVHAKREFLTDWIVYTLRKYDAEQDTRFYQADKVKVYQELEAIELFEGTLESIGNPESLENESIITLELTAIRALQESAFYDLMWKLYQSYKDDPLVGSEMPVAAQALSAAGDTQRDTQNVVANADHLSKKNSGGWAAKLLKPLLKQFSFFKKSKKQTQKAAEQSAPSRKPDAEETTAASTLVIENTGKALKSCLPLVKSDLQVKGQKQDRSFNNMDEEISSSPKEQEFLVDMFNVEQEANKPVNSGYQKFYNATAAILRSYSEGVESIQKKQTKGASTETFTEQVFYGRVNDNVILAIGNTNMGQSKNLGSMPDGVTAYFRLFVRGDFAKNLPKSEQSPMLKEFQLPQKKYMFTEVNWEHFEADQKYHKMLVEAMAALVGGTTPEEYEVINDMTGFIGVLEQKMQQIKN